ncbi:DUF1168-domain-containing protein [Neoconidiobolus thromboides FSU 785]|nr:DUF1168-domain-containing protein [Neoconidiobolus thromboides FSU 785]
MSEKEQKDEGKTEKKGYHIYTEQEKQKIKIEKLMKHKDVELNLPLNGTRNKLDPFSNVPEINPNVQGSSAGAGSGEFHVYRAQRRREYSRLAAMEAEARNEKEREAYQKQIENIRKQEEEKTAKKRAKRLKRKGNLAGKNKDEMVEKKEPEKKFKMTANVDAINDIKNLE